MIPAKINNHQKTIIALWNSGNKGKTETLREFSNILINTYPNNTAISPIPLNVPTKGDFRIVVEINGITVGIESQGDPNTNLRARLLDLANNFNCDLILCTTRTRGDTVHAVENLHYNFGYETIWTSTYQVSDLNLSNTVNQIKARHILDLLQTLNLI